MNLYYSPGACSLAPHIVAREASLAFNLVKVDLAKRQTETGEDYLAINPRGLVPAIQLNDGEVHTEVAALVLYLAEQAPPSNLAPPAGSKERLRVNQWLAFVATELHKTFSPWLFQAEAADSTKQASRAKLGLRFTELDRHLATRPYLTGDTFTVADAYAFTIVNWSNFVRVDLAPHLNLSAYMARVAARPKVREALVAEGPRRGGARGSDSLTESEHSPGSTRRAELLALTGELRPELHRYCARLMGSVMDGEDVVQDTLARAFVALDGLSEVPPLRAWLFRIAHNRALDLLRSRAIRAAEPIEAANNVADQATPDPVEILMRQEAVRTAVSRFTELPISQRSVVILKDVLDEPLAEIAALLDLTVDAVKAHLARGRARLREINAKAGQLPGAKPTSAAMARYVALFNQRDWDGLRALLADDVKLNQSTHPVRVGSADVGMFFNIYATIDGVWLVPAWLEGREVIALFESRLDTKPSYFMWLEWRGNEIIFIRDYKYVRYVMADAELVLASDAEPA